MRTANTILAILSLRIVLGVFARFIPALTHKQAENLTREDGAVHACMKTQITQEYRVIAKNEG